MKQIIRKIFNDKLSVISFMIFFIGTFLTIFVPYIATTFEIFGLQKANEIGDAFGGLTNPMVSFLGVVTTFLAFFIQFRANERQTNELEKQKRAQEFRLILEAIQKIKDDLRMLTYTKANVSYSFSEAIWYFMIDQIESDDEDKKVENKLGPFYFQLSYLLTLFEPMINDIEDANIETKEKMRAFSELDALYISSLDLILRLVEGTNKSLNRTIKAKIVVPCKRIKIVLKDKLRKYKESDKDLFSLSVLSMRAAPFIKSFKLVGNKGTIIFFKSYDDYLSSNPVDPMSDTAFLGFFASKDKILRFLIAEPVRLLGKMYFVERLIVSIALKNETFIADYERNELENYIRLDLEELSIDKELWRDNFVGKFVFDPEKHEAFVKKFIKIT